MSDTTYPFQNPDLPLETRVNDLVSRFTLDEKIDLMPQYQAEIPRLGVAKYKHGTEAAHGVAWLGEATTFPQPIGLACTWDTELLARVGSVIGDEARGFFRRDPAINGLTLWAPTVDMERDPRWGRTEEAYGEDPHLVGKLASALIRGIQGPDPFYLKAVASLKHFIGNNNEVGRADSSVSIDPRNMREYYLKAFELPFVEGGAQSMMTAYNAVNGVPANLNPDVNRVVKQEWGMSGFVVSDAWDVSGTMRDHGYTETHKEGVAASIKAGIDSLTDDSELMKQSIREALADGLLTENDLDIALRNTFRVRFRLGEFDPAERNPYAGIEESIILRPEHEALSLETSRKSIVLLKNEGNLLPLAADKLRKVAVIGPLAGTVYRDWYSGSLPYAVTPLQGIAEKLTGEGPAHGSASESAPAAAGDRLAFANGSDRIKLKAQSNGRYVRISGSNDQAALAADTIDASEADVFETTDWGWDSHTIIAEKNGRYLTTDDRIVSASSTQIWEWFTKEVFLVRPEAESGGDAATIGTWKGQPVTVNAAGELVVGSGDAAETANEINVSGAASLDSKDASAGAERFVVDKVTDGVQEAVQAARGADAAIVFVGNHPLINGKETVDRPDITLAESQERLIREVHAANPNTIVVIVGSYPHAANWTNANVPAILYTSHSGQELGRSIADVLFGAYNPAGRLNMTWYKSVDQLPDFMEYDIRKGKLTYQYFEGEALYPFGHGLSYSTFAYSGLSLGEGIVSDGGRVSIGCTVKNTSSVYGEEVVQLYVRVNGSRAKRPLKQLQGFRRIGLAAGETAEVTFELAADDLRIWDVTRDRYCLEKGDCTIMLGSSSENIRLTGTITVDGETIPPRNLSQVTRAANYDDYAGVIVDECTEGGDSVSAPAAEAGSDVAWIRFDDAMLDGGMRFMELRAFSTAGATLEVRIDAMDGALAGSCEIAAGGKQQRQTHTCAVDMVVGRHSLYLVLRGAANISWFRFGG
jgi:beta-glucosidase